MAVDEREELEAPELPTGFISLQSPPDQVESQGPGNILATMIPMMGSMGVMIFMAMSTGSTTSLIMGGGMVFAMLAMVGFNIYRQVGGHRKQVSAARREYLSYLSEMRESVRTVAKKQRRFISWHLPDPAALVLIAEEKSRLWEREPGAPELLNVRLGSSTQQLSMELETPPLPPLANPDPVCHSALNRFMAVHSQVDDMPFGVSLGDFAHIEVAGIQSDTKAQVRAMIAHVSTLIPPTLLKVAVLCPETNRKDWEWLKWLPHAGSGIDSDAIGPSRMIVSEYADLIDLIGDEVTHRPAFSVRSDLTAWPQLLLILDELELPPNSRLGAADGTAGVTVITMPTTWRPMTSASTVRLIVHPAEAGARNAMEVALLDQAPLIALGDGIGISQAEAIARRMASWSEAESKEAEKTPLGRADPKRSVDLMELLGIGDIRDFDPDRQWVRRLGNERLRVPFGVTPEGVPVFIDIKESAQFGMGPHGLLIGATGSGKSEVLRTLVLALALTHSPEQLNFVLVDFKGGATFAGMSELPHVSAMISNLESELFLVDRMEDALKGEMVRRQELLRKAGNYANVTDYEADRVAGKHSCEPMPALFLILDEFSELLSAKPDFIDTFVAIGRLGRSMSIHLLLSSQRLEEGRLRGLDSHLSYRIGLRTFSAQESRSVLGVPDAYELPSMPGVGYLKAGTEGMARFRASYVAAPPPARKMTPSALKAGSKSAPIEVLPFTSTPQLKLIETPSEPEPVQTGPIVMPGDERWVDMTEMDIAVERMQGKGIPAHQVWLPPLDIPDTFDFLMDDLAVQPGLGLVSLKWRNAGRLQIPLGTMDVPLEQRRETLVFDFSGTGGHMVIVGGPLTGKSTALRSLVMALSLTHTPKEVQFYVLDFGGTFATFEGAAHVAGIATRDQPDVVNRMFAEIVGIIEDREKYFRTNRIDSINMYREGRAAGKYDDGYGDIFLIVDGWATIRSDFEELEAQLQVLAARALSFGVHFIMASGRWVDFRQAIRDVVGSKFELRLGDTSDSDIDRKIAQLVPEGRPGRGLEVGKHHALLALPRADGDPNPATIAEGIITTLERIKQAWTEEPGPKLRLLPTKIDVAELRELAPTSKGIILGIEESRLGPLIFEPQVESHLYLFGDSKSGKSTFLRSIVREITKKYTPAEAQIVAVDLRRAQLGEIPPEYLFSYLTTRDETAADLGGLADFLRQRLPGGNVTTEQLRNRSWWSGADVWVLVDDYDLVATGSGNPVSVLQPLMAQAQDIGLHIIIARRSGGASRANYEPVIQTMNELGQTGILLSGSPDEGSVIGKHKMVKTNPGRAQVITRDAGRIAAQLAWSDTIG